MANEVYVNNMEISCKAASGKSIAAFPDVCFTPPQAPPTPLGVPIPYPNTGLSKDTTKGTRTIRITRKEVMQELLQDQLRRRAGAGAEEGHRYQQDQGQGVLHLLVDERQVRKQERGSPPRPDHPQPRVLSWQYAGLALPRPGHRRCWWWTVQQ